MYFGMENVAYHSRFVISMIIGEDESTIAGRSDVIWSQDGIVKDSPHVIQF